MQQTNKKPKGYPQKTSGGLWTQDKSVETQPDYKGSVEITREQMSQLVQMGKNSQEPRLQLAAWTRQDSAGKIWFSIGADVYVKDASAIIQAPAPAPAVAAAPPPPPPPPPPSFDDLGDDGDFS